MAKEKVEINFGEKEEEFDIKTGEVLPVWQSPKYLESKRKATEIIGNEKYNLLPSDFWILMNKTKSGKMAYTGLIISHNGCLKLNDILDKPVNPRCFSLDKEGYNGSLVYTYIDDDVYEVGEFSSTNGKNSYPYAMAYKRCFDRVVLKKSKLAYSGIYSEVEADEFSKNDEVDKTKLQLISTLSKLIDEKEADREKVYAYYKVETSNDMTIEQLEHAIKGLKGKGNK
jgi:hypothetical protein